MPVKGSKSQGENHESDTSNTIHNIRNCLGTVVLGIALFVTANALAEK